MAEMREIIVTKEKEKPFEINTIDALIGLVWNGKINHD